MDFYKIQVKEDKKKETIELYPSFIVGRSKDLMVQGNKFYAIWNEEQEMWSTDEYCVQELVDEDLNREAERMTEKMGIRPVIRTMSELNSRSWTQFKLLLKNVSDNFRPLDNKVIFANTEVKKTDYASQKLPYAIGEGDISAWDEMIGTLYVPEEREKIEWAIGSIVAGDSKKIQKFLVFYGPPGSGKSTILKIIEKLFEGYTTSFNSKELGGNGSFATEPFKKNPLVAIQHDGDLSRIEDNARLNSVISHERMTMNEKYKSSYTSQVDAMLFIGTNQPVKISDAKSGIIRRLIDVNPSGVTFPPTHYQTLNQQISLQLGAIAYHCLHVYLNLGKNYYDKYRPTEMMLQTDVFYNFIEAYYDLFKEQDNTSLKQAYALYKIFCEESGISRPLPQYKIRAELMNYFDEYRDRGEMDGERVRNVYSGFNADKFKIKDEESGTFSLVLDETESLFDEVMSGCSAQKASKTGTMYKPWSKVNTTLLDIDTKELHWVKVPEDHIVIDFDLKDLEGAKSLERNLEAASKFPPTYAELSKSGSGIHLHYSYTGDATELATSYVDGVEVKVFVGDASLRRRLSRCNAVPISEISSGLPLKEKKEKMLAPKTITSEKGLRDLINRNLKKEIHPGTKPSVDFILKILDDAYESGLDYDVTDMRSKIMAFANNSTNQATAALKAVQQMKFKSEGEVSGEGEPEVSDDRIVFYDCEVYSNLFIVCWKFQGASEVVKMINPSAREVEELFRLKLVGFYNRRYDNHIIYAASLGYTNEQLFALSQKLVENKGGATFGAAYNLSYADVWDFSSKKQSLKKFEIDLGITWMALDIPWNQPVDEKDWPRVAEYCANDVYATEAVFADRKQDFVARQILAELSGMTVNDTTQNHTAKIIFGNDKNPQRQFIYTDLSKEFPGYQFALGKSSYKGEDPGEGGYVYAVPGMYENVAVLDVISMHPMSIVAMQTFGPYTQKFEDLIQARMAIKRSDYVAARKMLDGRLAPFLEDEADAKDLAQALKIVVNIVYGLTSAKFDNPFRDIRNVDNIVAKRGALFMIELKGLIRDAGYEVIHIKTDSVKIPNADDKIIRIVTEFGKQYGYDFEHETTYDKFVLVNDAVFVGKKTVKGSDWFQVEWTTIGAQFLLPYVRKMLFTGEDIVFDDYCESRSVVQGDMYIDWEDTDPPDYTKMRYLGKTGRFVPVLDNGGILYRVKDDKYYAVSGTKGHRWMEAQIAKGVKDLKIDMSYFEKLAEDAMKTIDKFGDYKEFIK